MIPRDVIARHKRRPGDTRTRTARGAASRAPWHQDLRAAPSRRTEQPPAPRSMRCSLLSWTNTSSSRHATRGETPAAPLISGRLHRPGAHARSGRGPGVRQRAIGPHRAPASVESRRPVSSREWVSGWRLAVKRFALGPLGRLVGDGGTGHPLRGSEVGAGPRRGGNRDRDVLLQATVAGGVVGDAVLPAAPYDAAPSGRGCASRAGGRGRGLGRRRSGLAPKGASAVCCRTACRTLLAAACCSPSGSTPPCACRTRWRPRPGRRRRRARRRSGSALGSRRSRPAARRP